MLILHAPLDLSPPCLETEAPANVVARQVTDRAAVILVLRYPVHGPQVADRVVLGFSERDHVVYLEAAGVITQAAEPVVIRNHVRLDTVPGSAARVPEIPFIAGGLVSYT